MNNVFSINGFLLVLIGFTSMYAFSNRDFFNRLMHYPYQENADKSFYRWITCAFVHADTAHLLVNLLVLWSFGGLVERIYDEIINPFAYIIVFFVILILSNVPSFLKHRRNASYASVGASGVISGIVFIDILYFPTDKIYLFGVMPIPAYLFALLYLLYSWYAAKNTSHRIDHGAHFYGAIAGLLVGSILDQSWISKWQAFFIH